nr:protein TBATA [Meriones unguiculatus]
MTTEVKTQLAEHPLESPKAAPEPEKKPEHSPKSHGDAGFQKESVVPYTVDFGLSQEDVKASKLQTPNAYRFGRLSHHSFFSRHHPQPQRVTHLQDFTGKPICVVRDEFPLASFTQPPTVLSPCMMGMPTISVPIGDPQSNRNPQLFSDSWKEKLKDLASRVVIFTKEDESRINEQKEEPPLREQGAKYSTETGRLIPASSLALSRRSRHGQRGNPSGRDGGASILQNQELLILELLCQILQTDSLNNIQFWLLHASPEEKELALGLLQTAVAQLLPEPLPSIPAEKLLHQLQELQEPPQETQATYSPSQRKMNISPLPKPEYIGKAQVLRVHSSKDLEEMTMPKVESEAEG